MIEGRVTNVTERLAGTELAAAAAIDDETLEVVDVEELDLDGGTLQIGDEVISYTVADPDPDTLLVAHEVILDTPLEGAYDAEEPVNVYPPAPERFVYVLPRDHEEEILARVPHALYALLEPGARPDDDTAETVLIDLADDEHVLDEILEREPEIDGGFLRDGTGGKSDGLPPSSSPAPSVTGGPGYLLVDWDPIENADLVTYEVYLSAVDAFDPTEAELVGEVTGTAFVATALGDGSPLAYDTTYYGRLIARDADGAAAPGAQGSGSMRRLDIPEIEPINFTDLEGTIAAAQITALLITGDKIAANTIEAGKIAANTLTAGEIAAGAIEATELAAGSVTTAKIAAGNVTANEIAAGAITATKIDTGAVTATKISVTDLSAIAVSAGTITSGTFRGTTFETAAANPKVALDSTGLYATDSGGTKLIELAPGAGLTFREGDDAAREIAWYDGADKVARMRAAEVTGGYFAVAVANPDRDVADGHYLVSAYGGTPASQTYAQVTAEAYGDATPLTTRVRAQVFTPSGGIDGVTIIDATGASDFLFRDETTTYSRTLLGDTTAIAARSTLGLGTSGTYFPVPHLGNNASLAVTAGTLYFGQVVVHGDPTLTGVLINCTVAAGNAKALLYDSSGAQLRGGTGTAVTATQQKLPFTSSIAVAPGRYFVAVIFSGAPTISQTSSTAPAGNSAAGTYASPPASITPPTAPSFVPTMSTY